MPLSRSATSVDHTVSTCVSLTSQKTPGSDVTSQAASVGAAAVTSATQSYISERKEDLSLLTGGGKLCELPTARM